MKNPGEEKPAESAQITRQGEERKRRRVHWVFPMGVGLAALASAAAYLLRGCWHRNMSWPARAEDEHGHFSYQVCNDCGIMRLFDERTFRGIGPYGYDLHDLIAGERLLRMRRMQHAEAQAAKQGQALKSPGESAADSRSGTDSGPVRHQS
jgi:hypothetical protein